MEALYGPYGVRNHLYTAVAVASCLLFSIFDAAVCDPLSGLFLPSFSVTSSSSRRAAAVVEPLGWPFFLLLLCLSSSSLDSGATLLLSCVYKRQRVRERERYSDRS